MPQPTYSESVQDIETQFDNTLPIWEAFCQEQGIDPNEPTHLQFQMDEDGMCIDP